MLKYAPWLTLAAILLALTLAGCAGGTFGGNSFTNQTDLVNALAGDTASNCVSITSVYANIQLGRATPGMRVILSGGTCQVDSYSVIPTPPPPAPTPTPAKP